MLSHLQQGRDSRAEGDREAGIEEAAVPASALGGEESLDVSSWAGLTLGTQEPSSWG